MRALWLLGGLLLVSLALNAALYARVDSQATDLDAANKALEVARAENAQLKRLREADKSAMRALQLAQAEAAREAQEKRDALQSIDDALDDAAFCERIGGVWRERACPRDTDTAGGAAR